MKKALQRTHREFDIDPDFWREVIASCKSHYGFADYMKEYHLRPWVTDAYTLFIRNDLLDDSFVTYIGLVCKIKQPQ
jgi:hypothetical protein